VDEHATDDAQVTEEQKPAVFMGIGVLIGIGAGLGTVAGAVLDASRERR